MLSFKGPSRIVRFRRGVSRNKRQNRRKYGEAKPYKNLTLLGKIKAISIFILFGIILLTILYLTFD